MPGLHFFGYDFMGSQPCVRVELKLKMSGVRNTRNIDAWFKDFLKMNEEAYADTRTPPKGDRVALARTVAGRVLALYGELARAGGIPCFDKGKLLQDFISAYDYLKAQPDVNGKIGVVGFCFGGGVANAMAARVPGLAAAVPYYGASVKGSDVAKISAPLLLHFGELDKRINAMWPAYEKALKDNKKTYEAHFYPKANHGFHNDTTPRYDKEQAELSWKRTIDFFKKHLG